MSLVNLQNTLRNKLAGAERVAVLGMGSELRGDDVAGMLVADALSSFAGSNCPEVAVFHGGTAPENLTGEIKRFLPTHLIVVDAADTSAKPGTLTIIKPEELLTISFTTHMLPIQVMVDYLLETFSCQVTIIGIQPRSVEFGATPSRELRRAVKQLTTALIEAITSPTC